MPCTLLIFARDDRTPYAADPQRRGYAKGGIVTMMESDGIWGSADGPPDFVRLTISDRTLAELEQYRARWDQLLEFDVRVHDVALDRYDVVIYASSRRASDRLGEFDPSAVVDYLTDWNVAILTATQSLAPDAIPAQSGLMGDLAAITDDPATPDALWLSAGSNTATSLRMSFPAPIAGLRDGAAAQRFDVLLRKTAINNARADDTWAIDLYAAGVLVASGIATGSGVPTGGRLVSATWGAGLLGNFSGADVECLVRTTPEAGGSPGSRGSIEIGAARWQAGVAGALVRFRIAEVMRSSNFFAADVADVAFSEVSYDEGTGEHVIRADYSASAYFPSAVETTVADRATVLAHDTTARIIDYGMSRSEVLAFLRATVRADLDQFVAKRIWYFDPAVVDDALAAGGVVTRTVAQVAPFLLNALSD